jgi:hypothetical protein
VHQVPSRIWPLPRKKNELKCGARRAGFDQFDVAPVGAHQFTGDRKPKASAAAPAADERAE